MIFSVENSRTALHDIDFAALDLLYKVLRYPTPLAAAKEDGFVDPEAMECPGNLWDGWIRMLHKPEKSPPWFPTGLLSLSLWYMDQYNFPYQVNDRRLRPDEGMPELVHIPLRGYQKAAVRAGVTWGRGVFDLPPRGGKTRLACELTRQIALPTIWLAPTDRIVTQTQEVLESFFGKNYAVQIVGRKQPESVHKYPIILCTAATAVLLSDELYQSRQCIMVDEFHRAAANSYKKIFAKCDHIYFRYGMTGTFFRSGDDAMAMHGLLANTVYKITSEELRKQGHLVPVNAVFVPVLAPRLRCGSGAFNVAHGKFGIHEHEWRNRLVCECALKLSRRGRRVLILVGTKKQGRYIKDVLIAFWQKQRGMEFEPVEFVNADVHRSTQGKILKAFEEGQEVKILIGTSLLGEGVDLPSTDALVYARGERAEVSLTQNMYRVATAVPGKTDAVMVDFADRHRARLLEHSQERLAVYYAEPNFTVTVLQDPGLFEKWLDGGDTF